MAETIVFLPPVNLRVSGPAIINSADNTITVQDVTFAIPNDVRFEGRQADGESAFGLNSIADGGFVVVRAVDIDGALTAVVIEREAVDSPVSLQGLAGAVTTLDFDLFGRNVFPTTGAVYFNEASVSITEVEFFTTLQAGDLVRATGDVNGSGVLEATMIFRVNPTE